MKKHKMYWLGVPILFAGFCVGFFILIKRFHVVGVLISILTILTISVGYIMRAYVDTLRTNNTPNDSSDTKTTPSEVKAQTGEGSRQKKIIEESQAADKQDGGQSKEEDEQNTNSEDSQAEDETKGRIKKEELSGSQRLLRYATAALSFLSLITTGAGMKGYVFDKDWMAYIGSFAVQAILVVFSLLLCRFLVSISQLGWLEWKKRTMSCLLICFFSIALMVSSTFSFSYIAGVAYQDTKLSDSEITIQGYLQETTSDLKLENKRRGRVLLDEISNTANDRLSGATEALQHKEKAKLAGIIQGFHYEPLTEGAVAINADSWKAGHSGIPAEELDSLAATFNGTYSSHYDMAVRQYNATVNTVEEWRNSKTIPDSSVIRSTLSDAIQNLQTVINILNQDIESVNQFRGSVATNAVIEPRNRFQTEAGMLSAKAEQMIAKLTEMKELADASDLSGDGDISNRLTNLLSGIYLLGVNEENTEESVEALVKEISDIATDAASSSNLGSEHIRDITILRDELSLYSESLRLEKGLQDFIGEIRQSYQVVPALPEKPSAEEKDQHEELLKAPNAKEESEWRADRNDHFTTLLTELKSLPDITDIEGASPYDANKILKKTSTVQRDLLGELTDFERALNYFKYDYSLMAYFSAFIALFFDMGAFFTGCFLYATEFFKTREREEDCDDTDETTSEESQVENPKPTPEGAEPANPKTEPGEEENTNPESGAAEPTQDPEGYD